MGPARITLALVLALAAPAAAQPGQPPPSAPSQRSARAAAKSAFEEARRAYNLGHWDEAAAGFEKAYRLVGDPLLLFDRAQALRKSGRDAEAIGAYRAYLREQPEAAHRPLVEEHIRTLEQRRQTGTGAGGLDSGAASTSTGTPSDIREPTGGQWAGISGASTPPEKTSPRLPRWLPWAGMGLTLGFATGAIVTGLSANERFDQLRAQCAPGCSDQQLAPLRSRVLATNVLWALAGVSAVGTGVSLLVGPGEAQLAFGSRF